MSKLDLLISMDSTGSMNSVQHTVRQKVKELVTQIKKEVPDSRIGLIIHNDYCDRDTILDLPFTDDLKKLTDFLSIRTSQGGGDAPECYELALNYAQSRFNWESDKRVFVIVGDEISHSRGYRAGGKTCIHDWKEEVKKCKEKGITIYPIQCLNNSYATPFYKEMAQSTGGTYLNLLQFQYVLTYILGIFHKENGTLEAFEQSDNSHQTNFSLRSMFDRLFNRKAEAKTVSLDSIWKFQLMKVDTNCSIKEFVERHGIKYKAGKGYYELTKPEKIQGYKEILLVDRETDESITDTEECRKLLGIPMSFDTVRFNPRGNKVLEKYSAYVQSTSFTRKLVADTKFLYELDYK